MTITVPLWVLWTLCGLIGVPLVMLIGFFAINGFLMSRIFSKSRWGWW